MLDTKFRAWDKKDKCWLKHDEISYSFLISLSGQIYETDYYGAWKTTRDIVLMQFTGLKDKNGVEIYEGDICLTKDDEVIEIFWNQAQLRWDFIVTESGKYVALMYMDIKVIGNIYQNPELLEASNAN